MKKINEIGVSIIKCKNKQGTDNLKELHYKINDLLYKNANTYAIKSIAIYIEKQLVEYGIELNNLQVPDSAKAKKNEILAALRDMVINLRKYLAEYNVNPNEEKQAATAILKYRLSNYIKSKQTLTTDQIIALLEENKTIYDLLQVEYEPFRKMQDELIQILNKKFEI